jgi:hypothetical protein
MNKSMSEKSRVYKKCEGYKVYVRPPPKPVYIRKEKPIDYEELGEFGQYLKKGGAYSMRTGEVLFVNKK